MPPRGGGRIGAAPSLAAAALAAAAGFEGLQYEFSAYLASFFRFLRPLQQGYEALGAVIAFMLFVYPVCMVFLFGAEIASECPRLRGGAPGPEGSGDSPHTSQHD